MYIQFFFQSYNYPWKCTMFHIIVIFFFFRYRSEAYSVRPCGRQELQRRWTPAGSRSGLRGLSTDSSDFCWLVRCNPDIQWGEWISSDLGVLFIFHSSCTKYDLAEIFLMVELMCLSKYFLKNGEVNLIWCLTNVFGCVSLTLWFLPGRLI